VTRAAFGLPEVRRRRLALLATGALLGFVGLAARSAQLQVLQREELPSDAGQHVDVAALAPLRGDIVDRDGQQLATSLPRPTVIANPGAMSKAERARTARSLARMLQVPAARLEAKLRSKGRGVKLARGITDEQAEAVRKRALPEVGIELERLRVYPSWELSGRALAASYIGFADVDGNGREGIEYMFDAELRGRGVEQRYFVDGKGNRMLPLRTSVDERRGARVELALDSELQLAAERALERAVDEHKASGGILLALDPWTGDVLALAERPNYDPNYFWNGRQDEFRTRAFQWQFEPGSTLKPFVIAAALDAGVIQLGDVLEVEGEHRKERERMSLSDVLRVSSNDGASQIGDRLGSAGLVAGLRRFGFGSPTGSGFPGERAGELHELGAEKHVERAALSFGQGISVTAAQLAVAAASLANGGLRVTPRVALRVGEREIPRALAAERPVSRSTALAVRDMLRAVVERGTGKAAALTSHIVAGKTGTAQKVIDRKYSDVHFVANFLGIVPEADPRIVVVVAIDDPKGEHTGGSVAAPVFREFAVAAMHLLGVPAEAAP
jgi:cell division protein FtsI (penicillin-binding protein 3)